MEKQKIHKVKITICEIQHGKCSQDFKVGDSWIVEKNITPTNMCISAFGAIWPAVRSMRYGAGNPHGDDPSVARIACPDPKVVVVYEIRRLPD